MTKNDSVQEAADAVEDAAKAAADSTWLERLARAGFIANGIVHIILGVTAGGVAFGGTGEADQAGAIEQMAEQPFGPVLLWLCMLGCAVLAVWNLLNALVGSSSLRRQGSNDIREKAGRRRWKNFLRTLADAAVYGAVGVLFGRFLFGGGTDSGKSSSSASATLAHAPGGIVLLILIGAAIAVVGVVFCVNAVRRRWNRDLRTPSSQFIRALLAGTGIIGYVAKGITLIGVGILAIVSGLGHDPSKSTGVDGALKALRDQPFGTSLLAGISIGLVLYGIFLIIRSRYDRME